MDGGDDRPDRRLVELANWSSSTGAPTGAADYQGMHATTLSTVNAIAKVFKESGRTLAFVDRSIDLDLDRSL